MAKIILWIVVVFVILFALRLYNAAKARARRPRHGPPQSAAQAMVRCVQCGVYLPRPDARAATNGYRCQAPGCAESRSP
ncbi:MAG: hypothetical protein IT518_19980 [Burkholderiales bacterium]|nr:hypothetical protein [Burkholderiales bacterium]